MESVEELKKNKKKNIWLKVLNYPKAMASTDSFHNNEVNEE